MRREALLLACGLACAAALHAHDGEPHEAPAGAAAASGRPQRGADGALRIDKALQRRLGLRTVIWPDAAAAARDVELAGEVVARPEAAQAVIATEAGRLEAPDGGWPVAGRSVRRGEVLAWLRPALSQREIAERRAQIADLDQKLVISELTVERLRLQKAGAEDSAAQGNVYYEQSLAEHGAMVEQRRLLLDSLEGRQPLRAPADGRLAAVRAHPGDVVAAGQTIDELAAPGALRVVATSFDPQLARPPRAARLDERGDGHGGGRGVALGYRGSEPLADAPGWRLLFDLPAGTALAAGELVRVRVVPESRPASSALPAGACVLDAQGRAQVWLHEAAERFVARPVGRCEAPQLAALARGARLVTAGAPLLAGY